MAKQDLVVKLMLDSGAFGNDIREAERQTKEFSDKMKNAGKTVGDLGRELGISAGALGKLGGMMTGAAGVVAAFGAFKSIMESTHETSKKFHGIIAGFQGTLDTFQRSLAKADFSAFNRGLLDICVSAKKAEQAMRDLQLSYIAYGILNTSDTEKFKSLEGRYRDINTSDAERVTIKAEAEGLLKQMRDDAAAFYKDAFDAFMLELVHRNPYVNKKLSSELVNEYINQASRNRLRNNMEGGMTADMQAYAAILPELNRLYSAYSTNQRTANEYRLQGGSQKGRAKEKWMKFADEYQAKANEAYKIFREYAAQYDGLIVRNTIYDYNQEDFEKSTKNLNDANAKLKAITEMELQLLGWTTPTKPTTVKTTPTTTGKTSSKPDVIPNIESISAMEDLISWKKKEMKGLTPDTAEWWEAVDVLDSYNAELERLKKLEEELLGITPKLAEEVVPNIESVAAMKSLIAWKEAERDTFAVGTSEWEEAIIVLDSYNAELERLLKTQAEFESQFNPVAKFADLNLVVSSSISLLNGLGAAFSMCENESIQALAGVTDALSNIASGIMSFVQIQQAAAAASGTASAAAMPYPYNLAAIATVMSTILSVFANIKSMTSGKFAEGGIVGGTSYSGDKLFAMVNSGEMILNKRQQSNLSNMLGSGRYNNGGGQVEFHISGDALVGVLNNKRNKTHLTR